MAAQVETTLTNALDSTANDTAQANTNPDEITMEVFFERLDELQTQVKWFQKHGKQFLKKMQTQNKKGIGKKRTPLTEEQKNNRRSGFATPVKLDSRLAAFLGLGADDTMPRTEVTKRITAYIKEKELQQPDNRKFFVLDDALSEVFGVERGHTSSWFSLQQLLSKVLTSMKKAEAEASGKANGGDAANATNSTTNTANTANATTNGINITNADNGGTPMNVDEEDMVMKKKPPRKIKRTA